MNEFLLQYFIIFFGIGPLVIFGIILILLYKYKNILPTWHFFNLIFKFEELTALIKNNYELKKTKDGNITSEDLNLLYYYHNRMNGYGLEKYIR